MFGVQRSLIALVRSIFELNLCRVFSNSPSVMYVKLMMANMQIRCAQFSLLCFALPVDSRKRVH